MQVILIHSPIRVDPGNIASGIASPPLWAALLSATTKSIPQSCSVIDMAGEGLEQKWSHGSAAYRGLTPEQAVNRLPFQPDIIAFSCMFSSSWPMTRHLLHFFHHQFPEALLLIGGEHATALPHTVLKESPCHGIFLGEGEESFREFLQNLRKNTLNQPIPGLLFRRSDGTVLDGGRRKRIRNLDDLPTPDWSDIPISAYLKARSGTGASRGASIPILGTRGCPHQCTFCASPDMWTTSYYTRSPQKVAEEMQTLHQQYGISDFHFQDLTAIVSKSWTRELCTQIQQLPFALSWQLPSGTRSEVIDLDLAKSLAASGLSNMAIAFENADTRVLKITRKRNDPEKQMIAARHLMAQGIRVGGFFVVGHPSENINSFWLTWKLICRLALLGLSEINISTFAPVPGSADFKILFPQFQDSCPSDEDYDRLFNWLSLGRQQSFHPRIPNLFLRGFVLLSYGAFFSLSFLRRPGRLLTELKALLGLSADHGKFAKVLRSYQHLKNLKEVPTNY